MVKLHGVISDKIRAMLTAGRLDSQAIHPGRPESPKKASKLPKNVDGNPMTGRHKK